MLENPIKRPTINLTLAAKLSVVALLLAGCRSGAAPTRVRLLPSFDSSRTGIASANKNLIANSKVKPQQPTQTPSVESTSSGDTPQTRLPVQLVAFASNTSTRSHIVSKSELPAGEAAMVHIGSGQEINLTDLGDTTESLAQSLEQSPSDKINHPKGQSLGDEVTDHISDAQARNLNGVREFAGKQQQAEQGQSPTGAGESIDLAALEQMAIENNPALAQQRAVLASLNGRWLQAGLKTNPNLGFSGQQLFSRGDAEQIGMYYGRTIVRQEKLDASQQVVCREMDVAIQNLATVERRVLTDVRLRYYQVLIAQRRTEVTMELVKIAEESLRKTSSLFEAELGTRIDVLRSTTELQGTRLQHNTALNQRIAAWKQLSTVVGLPDLPLQQVHGIIEPDIELNIEELLSNLLQLSPEIGAAQADYLRAQAVLHRQCVEPLPNIEVQSILFQHDNGTKGYNSSLQVSLPIPIRNRNQGGISEARMQLSAAHYAQQKVALGLQERLAAAWQRYQSSLAQVKGFSAGDGILVNSRKTLELIRKAYDAGEIGSLELITAQRTYSQTSLQYLDALQEYWSARIELEGQLLKDSLQS